MSTGKIAQERTQRVLLELAAQPGNDICADCKTRNPRWASHNLGIFICVSCASIHRKMGTHVSKVKSLTLDSWSKEQLEIGNLKSNAIYNPNETRHPPPINAIDQERDSELEKFIRSKYEFKSYLDRSALVASKLGPSRSVASRLASTKSDAKLTSSSTASTIGNSASAGSMLSAPHQTPQKSTQPPFPALAPAPAAAPTTAAPAKAAFRSFSQPVPAPLNLPTQQHAQSQVPLGSSLTFNDLAGLQTPASNASLPLQFAQPQYSAASFNSQVSIPTIPTTSPSSISSGSPMTIPSSSSSSSFLTASSMYSNLSASPYSPYPSSFSQTTGISPGAPRSMSLGTGINGLSTSMTGMSLNGMNTSPYQQTQFLPQLSPAPSPNPFAPQVLTQSTGMNNFSQYNVSGQQALMNSQQPMQQPMQMFSPQPQQQSLQVPNPGNPYLPTPSPQGSPFVATMQFANTTPSPYATTQALPYTGQPSPYAASQPLPQMQMQQQLAQATNPFTSWIASGSQQTGGYPQQQQWGGGM